MRSTPVQSMSPAVYKETQAALLQAVGILVKLDLLAWSQAHAEQSLSQVGEASRLARGVARYVGAVRGECLAFLRAELAGTYELAGLSDAEVLDLARDVFEGRR